ncbi:MAG: peptidase M54 [Methanoculleus sp. SDB]|nr:MAG: peptidase M54 [Methanoculleus sp. SDB]
MGVIIFWDHQAPDGIQLPVARMISQILDMPVEVRESPILLRGFNRQRNQHNARAILDDIQDKYTRVNGTEESLLLVVAADLCIPERDFLFGLAREAINTAIISTARLGNGYYGRLHHDDDIIDRVVKEGAHEIGHLFGLAHCDEPECIMFLPETLDDLDRKKKMLCPLCREHLADRRDRRKTAGTAPAADREYL